MEWSREDVGRLQKEAWQEGYDAAMQKLRIAIKLRDMGIADCEIVKRTDLPPAIVHGLLGEHGHGHGG
ncbi:MAG: hypothetical protein HFG22_07815 [Lachnospiraceae bacterium]|nr:hypothetical protein [Lachnospiraceae bacterium]